jgi:hypothetical protein
MTTAVKDKQALIDQILVYAYPEQIANLKVQLPKYSVAELQHNLDVLKAEAAKKNQQIVDEELAAERQALAEQQEQVRLQAILFDICRTPINGKVLVQNEANLNMLLDSLNPGEDLDLETFRKIAPELQKLGRLSWTTPVTTAEHKAAKTAQREQNRRIFAEAARNYGFSECEANFNILSGALGNLDLYQIGQAIRSNAVTLARATEADRQRWAAERAQRRNEFLQGADVSTLRRAANQESAATRQATAQTQADAGYRASVQRDQATGGFKPMPDTFRGEPLTKEFLMNRRKCSGETLKQLIRLYGEAQVTARLRGIA